MFPGEEKKYYMELAFAETKKAEAQDEVSIGVTVVDLKGQVIGRGYNRRKLDNIVIHHAEILTTNEVCKTSNSRCLIDYSLFVTLEPCAMCVDAIINARLREVFYDASDHKVGASGSVVDLFAMEKFNCHPQVVRGLYRDKTSSMSASFFRTIGVKQEEKELEVKENKVSSNRIN